MPKKLQLTGKRFDRMRVLSEEPKRNHLNEVMWLCECDCGNLKSVAGRNLKRGHTRSCGCLQIDTAKTHGLERDPLYAAWNSMLYRCEDKTNTWYGGRGISVCDEWKDVRVFVEWARSNGYRKGLQIDRVNNNGNYTPGNCRFVSRAVNANNTRRNKRISVYGKELTVAEASREYRVPYSRLYQRICKLGWDPDRAVSSK